jgi:hypothetical protein
MSTSASSRSAAPPAGAGQSRQSSLDRRRLARAREGSEKGERGRILLIVPSEALRERGSGILRQCCRIWPR